MEIIYQLESQEKRRQSCGSRHTRARRCADWRLITNVVDRDRPIAPGCHSDRCKVTLILLAEARETLGGELQNMDATQGHTQTKSIKPNIRWSSSHWHRVAVIRSRTTGT